MSVPSWIAWAAIAVFGAYVLATMCREAVRARRGRRNRERLRAEWAAARAEEIRWQRERRIAEKARRENEAAPGSD